MRTLNLGKYRSARIWIGDLPDVSCAPQNTLIRKYATRAHIQYEARKAAVELFAPLGARSMYGLLGGSFVYEAKPELHAEVFISSPHERLFPESLAISLDEVRLGLPHEYGAAVFAGVESVSGDSWVASGRLIVDHAAHGKVSSCIAIYRYISAVLLKLFSFPNVQPSDDDLIALFPTDLT